MRHTSRFLGVTLLAGLFASAVGAQPRPLSRREASEPRKIPREWIWYGSNLGSPDLLDMFTSPDEWEEARARIDVFLLSGSQVGSGGWSCTALPHAVCGDNHLDNLVAVDAFGRLAGWGIDVAIESFFAGPIESVDPVVCAGPERVLNLTLNGSINYVENVRASGGEVRFLRIDEPLWRWYPVHYYLATGQTDPRPCLANSLEEVADHVVAYIQQMESYYPSIAIGQVELYPEVSVDTLEEWIRILEARGVSLPFLHVDVHYPRVEQYNSFGLDIDVGADLRELKVFADQHGVKLGIIFTDVSWDGQVWEPEDYTDEVYYRATLEWIDFIEAEAVRTSHRIYQSWVGPFYPSGPGPRENPVNLPESDPAIYSQTRLIRETR